MIDDCAALILAGGESRRMGRPKAWLEFDGRPLLAHLVERLGRVCPEVRVVCAPGQELPATPARVIHDERPGQGPVAGLAAGLKGLEQPLAFACSCDLPFLRVELVECLAQAARGYDVALCEWEGRLHPLHAVYRASLQPRLEARLAADQRRLLAVLDHVRHVVLGEAEIRALDPDGASFVNLNTPQDYAAAQQRWAAMRPRAGTFR